MENSNQIDHLINAQSNQIDHLINAQSNQRMDLMRIQVLEENRALRPTNTKRNYAPKQIEFKNWCHTMFRGASAETVTGNLKYIY